MSPGGLRKKQMKERHNIISPKLLEGFDTV